MLLRILMLLLRLLMLLELLLVHAAAATAAAIAAAMRVTRVERRRMSGSTEWGGHPAGRHEHSLVYAQEKCTRRAQRKWRSHGRKREAIVISHS